jgi:hypothetical protein
MTGTRRREFIEGSGPAEYTRRSPVLADARTLAMTTVTPFELSTAARNWASVAAAAALLLDAFGTGWTRDQRSTFVLTPGGFVTGQFPSRWQGGSGWRSRKRDFHTLVQHAEPIVERILTSKVLDKVRDRTDITVGIDLTGNDDEHAELVAVVDVARAKVVQWTGKSYPTVEQEHTGSCCGPHVAPPGGPRSAHPSPRLPRPQHVQCTCSIQTEPERTTPEEM